VVVICKTTGIRLGYTLALGRRLIDGLELKGDRVHAIALARRSRTVIEEMAEVASAPSTHDLDASHA
jgi:hypothetical protein